MKIEEKTNKPYFKKRMENLGKNHYQLKKLEVIQNIVSIARNV